MSKSSVNAGPTTGKAAGTLVIGAPALTATVPPTAVAKVKADAIYTTQGFGSPSGMYIHLLLLKNGI